MNGRRIFRQLAGLQIVGVALVVAFSAVPVFVNAQDPGSSSSTPAAPPTADQITADDPLDLHAAISAALRRKGSWKFKMAPLQDVVQAIRSTSGVDLLIDVNALEEIGLPPDIPITGDLEGVSLSSFLRIVLDGMGLTYEIRAGALRITTHEVAEGRQMVRTYPVTDLVRVRDDQGEAAYDYDFLIELITTVLAPDSWDQVGGPGAIEAIYGTLVVDQVEAVHEQIGQFLAAFRRVVRQHEENPQAPGTVVFVGHSACAARVQAALEKRIQIDLHEVPLSDAVKRLSAAADIPIVINQRALDDDGIGTDVPVTLHAKGLPARFALRRILAPYELSWTVHAEVLSITTAEECEARLATCLYPVHDLVAPQGAAVHEIAANDFDALIQVLTRTVDPDQWDDVGGPATIESVVVPPALVISHTEASHEKLRELLRQLRQAKQIAREARKRPLAENPHLVIRTYTMKPGHQVAEVLPLLVRLLGKDAFEGDGVVVQILGNELVVRHSSHGHRQINAMLSKLRVDDGGGGSGGGGGGLGGGGGFGGGGSF